MARRDPFKIPPSAVLRHYRDSRLHIAEHDGDLWVTDAYALVRLGEKARKAFEETLALYNLPLEPMNCRVEGTIVRQPGDAPDVGALLPGKHGKPIEPYQLGGLPVFVDVGRHQGQHSAVWTTGKEYVVVNPDLVEWARRLLPGVAGTWHACPTRGPLGPVAFVADKKTHALVMPIRTALADLVTTAAAA